VVDEAHAINYLNHQSCFMRILRHYKQEYKDMRLLGATGTNFRFKGASIVGDDCLFKSQVGNITTEQLIRDGYLVNPSFEIDKDLMLDFSNVRIKQNGQFDQKQLELVIERSARLTELICHQVVHIMESQKRFGVFFFATTKKHAFEILSHLPMGESAIILGETPQHERTEILDKARSGAIKYLVNIAIVSVGVDVPAYDTISYLRPTESLVLLVQTMGRALRLSPKTNKTDALVLDFAGNIERHRDWDNPLLLEAVKKTIDQDKPLVICCPACCEMNTEHARRCVGRKDEERCKYYFEFKECVCGAQNDIAARLCHACHGELIDPNEKLSMARVQNKLFHVDVLEASYGISGTQRGFRVNCAYKCRDESGRIGSVFEHYSPVSERAAIVFYGQFVKKHCANASQYYMHLNDRSRVEEMLHSADVPVSLLISKEENGTKIKKKIFN
jgi:DNA repair protein RadD